MSEHIHAANPSRRSFGRTVAGVAAGTAMAPAIVRAQTSEVKVGVILPKSGVLAQLGQSCQRGADIAPEVLREMYGVDIELMNADFESNVDTARARAEKLINDGAQVLVGPFDSGAAAAIAQVAEQRKVPFVINIAAAPQITQQGYKYTFRNFATSVDLIRNGLDAMNDTLPEQRVLTVRVHRFGDAAVEVAVIDRGHGISEEGRRQLFTPFYTTKAEGMGLGLSLCRTVVEQHGGLLRHEANEPQGTVFLFTLPAQGPARAAQPA